MLSFSSILSDARNFISNNFTMIFITVLILSIINQIVSFFFSPNIASIAQIQSILEQATLQYGELTADSLTQTLLQLSESDAQQLVSVAMSYLMQAGLVFFINNIILMSGILSLIYVITYQQVTLNNMLQKALILVPKIVLFMFLIIPGVIILSLLTSILMPLAAPLAVAATLVYLSTYMIFLSVIIEPTSPFRFMQKLKTTLRFFKRERRLILPMIAIWFVASFLLRSFAGMLNIDNIILDIVINIIKSLLIFITICYLYRLFSLSNKALPYDASN